MRKSQKAASLHRGHRTQPTSSRTSATTPAKPNRPLTEKKRSQSAVEGGPAPAPFLSSLVQPSREASKQLIEIQIQISKLLVRFRSLSAQVDEAYGGQVFFRDLDPTDPKNDRRFRCCIQQHWELTKLICYALKLWQRSYGCDIQDFLTALWAEHTRSNAEKQAAEIPNRRRHKVPHEPLPL